MDRTLRAGGDAIDAGDAAHRADVDLVRQALRREPAALDRLTQRMLCVPRFVSLRHHQLGGGLSRESLEDATQDALTLIWRKLGEYRGEASLETWAFRCCDLDLRNALRRARTRRQVAAVDPAELALRGDLVVEPQHDEERLHAALATLPLDEAEVVRLKHFEALTFEEIAVRLSVSPNTAKSRYYRALERLRQTLHRAGEAGS